VQGVFVATEASEAVGPAWWRPLEWPAWGLALEPVNSTHTGRVRRAITNEIARWLKIESADEMRLGTAVWAYEADGLARTRRAYRYLVARDGEFAGVIELRPDAVQGHIGYWQRRKARGRGTMTMANYAMLLVAFDGLLLGAVDWTADVSNAASIAVMERLGGREIDRYPVKGSAVREEEVRVRVTRGCLVSPREGPETLRALLGRPQVSGTRIRVS
jgi:RimJ/RimL family protein N-acetyltransferase